VKRFEKKDCAVIVGRKVLTDQVKDYSKLDMLLEQGKLNKI